MTSAESVEVLNIAVFAHGSLGTADADRAAVARVTDLLSSVPGLRLLATAAASVPSDGVAPASAHAAVFVYLGAGDVDAALRVTLPTVLWFEAACLTGYRGHGLDFAVELGLMQLHRLAPTVCLAVTHDRVAAEYLRRAVGFADVVEADDVASGRADVAARLRSAVAARDEAEDRFSIQVQGPFDSTYSLAVVNAGIALALDRSRSVFATLDVAPGDQIEPNRAEMIRRPALEAVWRKGLLAGTPNATIRNSYPPLPEGMESDGRFLYFFWEDSLIPADWAARFNRSLSGVLAPSRHVRAALRDSGVVVPIGIVPCGLNTDAPGMYGLDFDLGSAKGFRFLHVSSAFARKGIDVLLEAYGQEFTALDDVTLVLKTFPNPHNRVADQIAEMTARHPCPPEVIHIDRDLPDYAYYGLFRSCDAFVSTTRCEGFGLPMAEAMLFGLPVIVTAYSGQMDFCSDETSFLIGATMVPSHSHFDVPGAMWAEPSVNDTRMHMRTVYQDPTDALVRSRVSKARDLAAGLSWDSAAEQAVSFIRSTMGAL